MAKEALSLIEGFLKDRPKPLAAESMGDKIALLKEMKRLDQVLMSPREHAQADAEALIKDAFDAKKKVEALQQEKVATSAQIEEQLKRSLESRVTFESEISELKTTITDLGKAETTRKEETARLRENLREVHEEAQGRMATIKTYEERVASAEREKKASEKASEKAAKKAAATHQKKLKEIQKAKPRPASAPPVKPKDISFVYHRDMNGRLSNVKLMATGYNDVDVAIVRGADGRMRDLKIEGPQ